MRISRSIQIQSCKAWQNNDFSAAGPKALFTSKAARAGFPGASRLADCAAFAQSGMLCADLAHDGEKPLPLRAEEY
jgi:hypothetical protein